MLQKGGRTLYSLPRARNFDLNKLHNYLKKPALGGAQAIGSTKVLVEETSRCKCEVHVGKEKTFKL
jgi:hypothetical protein